MRKYRTFQNDESRVIAYDLLSTPEDYVKHFERYATSVVSIIGFGRRVESNQDPIITEGEYKSLTASVSQPTIFPSKFYKNTHYMVCIY